MRLNEIEFEILRALRTERPNAELPPTLEWFPLIDSALGDVGTEICLQYGGREGTPHALAEAVLNSASPELRRKMSATRGFLNLNITGDDHELIAELCARACSPRRSRIISVLPGGSGMKLAGALRLASIAFLHFFLHRTASPHGDDRFVVGTKEFTPASPQQWPETFRAVLQHVAQNFSPGENFMPSAPIEENAARFPDHEIRVWSSTRSLPPREFDRVVAKWGSGERMVFYPVTREWVTAIDESRPERVLEWPSGALGALLLYFSEQRVGHEIDLFVPRSSESENLLWYLASTAQRLDHHRPDIAAAGGNAEHASDDDLRTSWVRNAFLPVFYRRAIANGAIYELLAALRQMASSVNTAFNSPHFRHRLERHTLSAAEQEILYGVIKRLLAIIQGSNEFGFGRGAPELVQK